MLGNFPNDTGRCLGQGMVPWERRRGYLLGLLYHYVSGQRLFLTVFQNLCLGMNVNCKNLIIKYVFFFPRVRIFFLFVCNDVQREVVKDHFQPMCSHSVYILYLLYVVIVV